MLTRRDFGLGLGALGLGAGLPALAQAVRVMKVANTAAVNDPQQCFVTAGQHPKLDFYKPGGVDLEYVNMSSMTQALQSLRNGHADFGPAVPGHSALAARVQRASLDEEVGRCGDSGWAATLPGAARAREPGGCDPAYRALGGEGRRA